MGSVLEKWGALGQRSSVCKTHVLEGAQLPLCGHSAERVGGPGSRGLQRGRQRPDCGFGYYPKNDRKPLQDFKQEGDLIGSSLYKDRFGCSVMNRWKELWSKNRKKVKA